MRFTTFYGYAKVRSGELRPGIKTVEETVKSVVGLVNEKFRLVPDEILRHTDTNQDNQYVGHRTPVANIATTSKMVVRLYAKCEPMAEKSVTSAWQKVKQSLGLHRVASVAAPKAAYCTKKYNEAVLGAAEKGCRVSVYLPLVQTERIAKMFSEF